MQTLEALKVKLEVQIEAMLDTTIEIEKLEQAEPGRIISDWHQITISMLFYNSVLIPHIWEKMKNIKDVKKINEIMEETGLATHTHMLEIYGFDSKKMSDKKIKD